MAWREARGSACSPERPCRSCCFGQPCTADAPPSLVGVAQSFSSGRALATAVAGDGKWRTGTGPLPLDWDAAVSQMRSADLQERIEYARAVGVLARSPAHSAAACEAHVTEEMVELLAAEEVEAQIAAASAIRHLACASAGNRATAVASGAVELLVAMLAPAPDRLAANMDGLVTASACALRNMTHNDLHAQAAVSAAGGVAPLLALVAVGDPPAPPPVGGRGREAAFFAAGCLENLAGSLPHVASTIVVARAVPPMATLLLGAKATAVSKKSAAKWRSALVNLLAMEAVRSSAAEACLLEALMSEDVLHSVFATLQRTDEGLLVPYTGAVHCRAVCRAWKVAADAPCLWERAHAVLRAQAVTLSLSGSRGDVRDMKHAPQRPRAPFALWVAAHGGRAQRDASAEWASWVEAERALVVAWKALSAAERAHWEEEARRERQRYVSELERGTPWLRPTDDATDLRLCCSRLGAHLHAERRQRQPAWAQRREEHAGGEAQCLAADAQEDGGERWPSVFELIDDDGPTFVERGVLEGG
jgi:hypothetical protein